MSKIYTKTGDKGKTSLFGGQRVLKSNDRVQTYGTVDELNSVVGAAIAFMNHESRIMIHEIQKELIAIQSDLLSIGASLANTSSEPLDGLTSRVLTFEATIDTLTRELPELRNFILPGGSVVGAHLHLARSVARRCERQIVALSQTEPVDKNIIIYFNRLSDLLFTYARYVNFKENTQETVWNRK